MQRGVMIMNFLKISDLSYKQFNIFLEEKNVPFKKIRIYSAGKSCHGTMFNITVDNPKEGDLIQQIGEITFIVDRNLFIQYSGFILLCGDENGLGTFSLEPVFKPEQSDCSSCHGCSSSDD
jgi:HesB-like selenoprotein